MRRMRLETVETRGGIEKRLDRIGSLADALVSLVDELREYVKRQEAMAPRIPKKREPLDLKGRDKKNEKPTE